MLTVANLGQVLSSVAFTYGVIIVRLIVLSVRSYKLINQLILYYFFDWLFLQILALYVFSILIRMVML